MYRIVYKKRLNPTVTLMDIEAPFVAKKAKAGQFIILRVDEEGERIPLTVAGYDRDAGTVRIIFQIVGATTKKLGELSEGEYISDFAGPLGKPTKTEGIKSVCIVGGGVGCAIALPVAEAFAALGPDVRHAPLTIKSNGYFGTFASNRGVKRGVGRGILYEVEFLLFEDFFQPRNGFKRGEANPPLHRDGNIADILRQRLRKLFVSITDKGQLPIGVIRDIFCDGQHERLLRQRYRRDIANLLFHIPSKGQTTIRLVFYAL